MEYRIIKPEEYRSMPWKNGKGVTTELFAKTVPDLDKFIFRLSIAGVTEDGEFSDFSGYERTLIMLEGNGIVLHHSDGKRSEVLTTSDKAVFSGDVKTVATLAGGPIKDFNVMVFRAKCVSDVKIASEGKISVSCDELFIYAISNSVIVHKTGRTELKKNDLLHVCEAEGEEIAIDGKIISVSLEYLRK